MVSGANKTHYVGGNITESLNSPITKKSFLDETQNQ